MTVDEKAFTAGWIARSDTHNCEWADSFPNRPDLAYMKWKGVRLPRPTTKQEEFMRTLGIWDDKCRYMTVQEAKIMISTEVNRRKASKRYYSAEELDSDPDDYDYAVADEMMWGYDD